MIKNLNITILLSIFTFYIVLLMAEPAEYTTELAEYNAKISFIQGDSDMLGRYVINNKDTEPAEY